MNRESKQKLLWCVCDSTLTVSKDAGGQYCSCSLYPGVIITVCQLTDSRNDQREQDPHRAKCLLMDSLTKQLSNI